MSAFIRYPDPRLTRPAALADGVDDALRATGQRLLAAAKQAEAFGLAAVHLGEVAPVVVISVDGTKRDYRLLFNPKIVAVASETLKGEEASVSLPGVVAEIERPVWAEIAHQDETGRPKTTRFEGFAARVALHEIEQMQGIFFLDRLSRLKRQMALKKARKLASS